MNIVLPLAISFFTFQQITYLVDTHKENVKPHTIIDYMLFVTFFPQLIAGPIVHHKEMMPQFSNPHFLIPNTSNISKGLSIFGLGLFKKVVIADYFALLANPIFEQSAVNIIPDSVSAWMGAIAYTLQLYFDFSGYSDMAIGLALIFGITLPYNFNSPYKSKNIIEFWRRWHMTLSRFLKDYIYIPLGGNKKGKNRRLLNLFITMFLGGLWHGAGWTFILWGLLHGLFLAINHSWVVISKTIRFPSIYIASSLGRLLTFICIVIAWVVFRAENIESAINIITPMLTLNYDDATLDFKTINTLCAGLLIVWFAPNSNELFSTHGKPFFSKLNYKWCATLPEALLTSALIFIAVIYLARAQEFLYFQF